MKAASTYQINSRVPKHLYDIVQTLAYTYDIPAAHVAERLYVELFKHPEIVRAAFADLKMTVDRQEAEQWLREAKVIE